MQASIHIPTGGSSSKTFGIHNSALRSFRPYNKFLVQSGSTQKRSQSSVGTSTSETEHIVTQEEDRESPQSSRQVKLPERFSMKNKVCGSFFYKIFAQVYVAIFSFVDMPRYWSCSWLRL